VPVVLFWTFRHWLFGERTFRLLHVNEAFSISRGTDQAFSPCIPLAKGPTIWRDRRCVMAMSGRCSEVWSVSEPLKRSQSRGTDALRKVGAYIGRPVKNIWQVTCLGPFGLESHNRQSGARGRHPKTLAPPPPLVHPTPISAVGCKPLTKTRARFGIRPTRSAEVSTAALDVRSESIVQPRCATLWPNWPLLLLPCRKPCHPSRNSKCSASSEMHPSFGSTLDQL